MKRRLGFLIIAMAMIVMPLAVFADEGDNDGAAGSQSEWTIEDFTLDEAGTTVTGLSDSGKTKLMENPALVIPNTNVDGDNIIGIGAGATNVGTFAFTDEESGTKYEPTSVKLPANLETIGNFAFATAAGTDQNGITSLELPSTVKTIGMAAFQNAPFTEVVIPDSVTSIGNGAFTGNDSNPVKLEKITFGSGVTAIPSAICVSQNLKEIVIPEGVTTIDNNAFSGNHTETLSLPSTLTVIGNNAFLNHQLSDVDIPSNVRAIGSGAFRITQASITSKLTNITLHEGLTSIAGNTFAGNALTEVDLPTTVTTLNRTAFASNASTVTVNSVVKEQANAEGDYTGVVTNGTGHKVVFNDKWTTAHFTFDEEGTTVTGLTDLGKTKLMENPALVIPDTNAKGENIIGIGAGATNVGTFAFTDEESGTKYEPTSVKLPANLETIGNFAFATAGGTSQNGITSLELPSTVKTIGISAFQNATFTEVVIPDSVTSIGNGAFTGTDSNPVKLEKITFGSGITEIPQAICVSQNLKEIVIPEGVTSIGNNAFSGNHTESLSLPSTLTSIGNNAFMNHQLTEVEIPSSVKTVGSGAFRVYQTGLTSKLTNITLHEGLTSIAGNTFAGNVLTEVNLPTTVTTLAKTAFASNTSKVTVYSRVKAQANSEGDYTAVVKVGTGHEVIYRKQSLTDPIRISGSNRYKTAIAIADEYLETISTSKFDNVVVASGQNYPDALSGSYLAYVKNAPILLIDDKSADEVIEYIKSNLKTDGTVYILGGTSSVSADAEAKLSGLNVERLSGASRYDTNIEILRASGVTDAELLICTGAGFADSLSAAGVHRPILLVGNTLTSSQKEYLESLSTKKAYAIGGTNSVSNQVTAEYKDISGLDAARIAGTNRYSTSVEIAKTFFADEKPTVAVLASATSFPDGLAGASLAASCNAPILLITDSNYAAAKEYLASAGINTGYILGGTASISDKTAFDTFGL